MYKKALIFATRAHAGQRRNGGDAYIVHPIRVSHSVETDDQRIIALLHDTIEDTAVTYEDIEREFGKTIAEAVECLTHREGEDYRDYIGRVLKNEDAIAVKIADICDNMADCPTEKAIKRSAESLTRLLNHQRIL